MNLNGRSKTVAAILAGAAISAVLAYSTTTIGADVPPGATAAPTDVKPARTRDDVIKDWQATALDAARLTPPSVLADEKQRAEAAPKAIPLAYRQIQLIDELVSTRLVSAEQADSLKMHGYGLLYLLGDAPTVAKAKEDLASTDSDKQIRGQSLQFYARWIVAAPDKDAATKVADDLEKFNRAHPDNTALSHLTLSLAQEAGTLEMNERLLGMLSTIKTDEFAKRISAQIAAQKKQQEEADAVQRESLNKPYVIQGKTVQGSDFSTDSLKGKVVLIDFWATWCGPCKAGLPHVKEIYGKYHDQGLEIVGISNDYAAKDLLEFTPKNGMPWTQLFDPAAAAEHRWNPISEKNGVEGIPCFFLIDKKGILRSVTREPTWTR